MVLTRNVQRTLPIPHEQGETMTLRQLGFLELSQAEEVRSAGTLRNLQSMGPELFQSLQNVNRGQVQAEAATEQRADPAARYDRRTILHKGIVAWSYSEPVTPDNIDSLDVMTADWAAREIVSLGLPPPEKVEDDRFLPSPTTSMVATANPQTNGSSA